MMEEYKGMLEGRVALVTGASRGIGAAAAKAFAACGAHVIMLGRSAGDLERVDDAVRAYSSATIVPVDFTKQPDISALAQQITQRFGRLDVLFCGAALLGGLRGVAHGSDDHYRRIMAVTVDAHWRIVRELDALMAASARDGGVDIIMPRDGRLDACPPYWGLYLAAKSALETLLKTYGNERRESGIFVHCVDAPEEVATNLWSEAFPGRDKSEAPPPEEVIADILKPALLRRKYKQL